MNDRTPTEGENGAPGACLPVGKKILFALLIVMALPSGGEVLCRAFGLGRRVEVAQHVSQWQHAPDGTPFWVMKGPEYNSDGMRDREHAAAKPADTFRIACLGDSVTVGHGVRESATYPCILESYMGQLGLSVEGAQHRGVGLVNTAAGNRLPADCSPLHARPGVPGLLPERRRRDVQQPDRSAAQGQSVSLSAIQLWSDGLPTPRGVNCTTRRSFSTKAESYPRSDRLGTGFRQPAAAEEGDRSRPVRAVVDRVSIPFSA